MKSSPFTYCRRISFADTDASGVAHFSRLLCLVEEAEHQALRSLGIEVFSPDCGWPRVNLAINYRSPAQLNEELVVTIHPGEVGHSSLEWIVNVKCGERPVLDGSYVVVRIGTGGGKIEIPAGERAALQC